SSWPRPSRTAPRPVRWPVMYQTWSWLGFLHWSYEPAVLAPLLAARPRPPPGALAGDFPGLGLAGVPALVVRAGGAGPAAAGRPAPPHLRRPGLGRADPVLPPGPAHPAGAGPALVHQLPRDQRPHLRGRPRRARRALVLLPGRGPAGAGAGGPLDLRPPVHVVGDDGGAGRAAGPLPPPPALAGPGRGDLGGHPGGGRPAGPGGAGRARSLPDRPLAALHHPGAAAGPVLRRSRPLAAAPVGRPPAGQRPGHGGRAPPAGGGAAGRRGGRGA